MKLNVELTWQIPILLLLTFFVVFLKLGAFHMRLWDESMFAVNTYEMMHNGHYFSNYYEGHPDITNTKPPVTLWAQIACVKLFGYNELALRLPSALAASLALLFVFIFVYKNYSPLWAWLSALVMLTAQGFIGFHTARTADADSLLTMFLLLANLSFIKFITTEKKQDILLFFLFLTLAFATKLWAALLFAPAWLVILILYKRFKSFTLNGYFLSGLLLFLLINGGLVWLKMQDNPGYLSMVMWKDAGRLLSVVEYHKESFSFYIDNLINHRFSTWFALLVAGCVFAFLTRIEKEKQLLQISLLLTLSYFLIISISVTRLEWYDMPLFPLMSILAAYPLFILLRWYIDTNPTRPILKVAAIVLVIFAYPYYLMFCQSQRNSLNGFENMNEASERFLFHKNNENADIRGTKVLFTGFNGSLLFYKYKMHEMGQDIQLTMHVDFQPNDRVLVSNDSLKNIMQKEYTFTRLDSLNNAVLVKIESKIHL